ncbi:ArsR family transcriptional regulator [Paenibacillus sp. Marseille-Q4541]|uniref:ArsR/SmtB family transcription factor n=1 Tax=Paenibacillus sp. Marseille-Q4541 TaxID=2831522 RepID=UPI001BA68942|nr:ArsR family transcriptional regulator [Paenibacillus sp. Marseille-Q4541]
MKIPVNRSSMPILECFSSSTRVHIIELLNKSPHSIKELAGLLGLSAAITTKHIQKLEEAGIVSTRILSGTRGAPKICTLAVEEITLQLHKTSEQPVKETKYTVEIPVGQYSSYEVNPTCGLASSHKIIGLVDDPRYFSDPERTEAAHLWFGSGYVEYRVPNYLYGTQHITSLEFALELCSEAPKYNEDWPSDISFYINDVCIGMWTCPGDFGSKRGALTPSWWDLGTQNGLLKTLSVRTDGTYLDGVKLSDISLSSIPMNKREDFRFRLSSPPDARNAGGISLFGKKFGNYDQDIRVTVHYEEA